MHDIKIAMPHAKTGDEQQRSDRRIPHVPDPPSLGRRSRGPMGRSYTKVRERQSRHCATYAAEMAKGVRLARVFFQKQDLRSLDFPNSILRPGPGEPRPRFADTSGQVGTSTLAGGETEQQGRWPRGAALELGAVAQATLHKRPSTMGLGRWPRDSIGAWSRRPGKSTQKTEHSGFGAVAPGQHCSLGPLPRQLYTEDRAQWVWGGDPGTAL